MSDASFSRSRSWRSVFLLSMALRIFFLAAPAYIHPDEHFQGPEAVADRVLAWATHKPWEFTSDHPIRSFAPLYTLYGIPMAFADAIFNSNSWLMTPLTVYYTLRVIFGCGSWILCDMAIDRLSDSKQERIRGLLFYATSYVSWTFQSHTFSNAVETVVVLWCLVILHEFDKLKVSAPQRHFDSLLLGVLLAFGVLNRVTFPAFILLPCVLRLPKQFVRYPWSFMTMALAIISTVFLAVYVDTVVYSPDLRLRATLPSLTSIFDSPDKIVLTTLNNLLYNTSVDNLARHGLHPRVTHVLVNLPMLLGPGLVFLATSSKYFLSLPFVSAVSGIAILSLIPHQEARFLVPAVPLLCLCLDTSRFSRRALRFIFTGWVVFNLALGSLFGLLHQGGVVPCQAHLAEILRTPSSAPATIIWWKTYSPPAWLLGLPQGTLHFLEPEPTTTADESLSRHHFEQVFAHLKATPTNNHTTLVDAMGVNEAVIEDLLQTVIQASVPGARVYIAAPLSVFDASKKLKARELSPHTRHSVSYGARFRLNRVWSRTSHLSMESLNWSDWRTLRPGLGLWQIQTL